MVATLCVLWFLYKKVLQLESVHTLIGHISCWAKNTRMLAHIARVWGNDKDSSENEHRNQLQLIDVDVHYKMYRHDFDTSFDDTMTY